jgi:hypothetical protein
MDPELETQQALAGEPGAQAAAAPEPAVEEQALAALDEALTDGADGASAPGSAGEASAAPAPTPAPAAAADGKPEAAAAEGGAGAKKPEAAAKPGDDPAKKVEPTADEKAIEKEITDRGLKGDTATRFRELANQVRDLSPMKDAIEKAGIKDLSELPKIVQDASSGREIFQQIQDAGVNPEQYGMLLDAGALINKAMRGDVKSAERAIDLLTGELVAMSKLTGREIPGVHDPLAEHADLRQQVEAGNMTRQAALQVARARHTAAMAETGVQVRQHQQQAQDAVDRAQRDLDALGVELAGADPHYAAKAPVLMAQLRGLMGQVDPARLPAIARRLYGTIPNPAPAPSPSAAPAPAAAKPTPGPVRGVGVRPAIAPVPDDPMEALEMGLADADGMGWSG